ncbi:MAG: DUF1559 domain-containing protein [Pirellulales bacterium]
MLHRTNKVFLLVALVTAAATPSTVWAQDQQDLAATIAPYLDSQTVAVVHVDLQQLEAADLLEYAKELLSGASIPVPEETWQGQGKFFAWLEGMRMAGAREFFVVISISDLAQGAQPFVVVPLAGDSNARAIAGLLYSGTAQGPASRQDGSAPSAFGFDTSQQVGGAIVAAQSQTLERLRVLEPHELPNLEAALAAVSGAPVRAALLPTEDQRRVVREMLGGLPLPNVDQPGERIAEGIRWAAAGIKLQPEPEIQLIVQSQSPEAAQRLQELWAVGLKALGAKIRGAELRVPGFAKPTAAELETLNQVRQGPQLNMLIEALTPEVQDERLVMTWDLQRQQQVLQAFAEPVAAARAAAQRTICTNNLKQLALGMVNHESRYGVFPRPANRGEDGKPLLSWRVHILPFIDEDALYGEFHLDEPWESEHNRKLIPRMPKFYACPVVGATSEGKTTYQVLRHPDSAFPGDQDIKYSDIHDGARQTILIVEVAPENAVIWTKPDDLELDLENPLEGLGFGIHGPGFTCVHCEGSGHFHPQTTDPSVLKALFTRAGGEPVQ